MLRYRTRHNEELHNSYFLPNINGVRKARNLRLEGHVTGIGENKYIQRALARKF